eukprot:scaffold189_cov249-Pinguiococcus_pyrenoidosus.AAC.15
MRPNRSDLAAPRRLVDQSEEFGYAAQWSDAEKKSAEAIKSLHDGRRNVPEGGTLCFLVRQAGISR